MTTGSEPRENGGRYRFLEWSLYIPLALDIHGEILDDSARAIGSERERVQGLSVKWDMLS